MALLQLRFEYDSRAERVEHESSTACYNTLRGFSCARIRVRYEHPTKSRGGVSYTVDWQLIIVYRIINFTYFLFIVNKSATLNFFHTIATKTRICAAEMAVRYAALVYFRTSCERTSKIEKLRWLITGRTDRPTDRVRRNMRPPPREEGRIKTSCHAYR